MSTERGEVKGRLLERLALLRFSRALLTPARLAAFTVGVVGLLLFGFQDTIGLWLIDPQRSYEAFEPPPAPDYGEDSAWLVRGSAGASQAPFDVFYVHDNVYHGDGGWNARYDRRTHEKRLMDVIMPLQVGPFLEAGASDDLASAPELWVPRFRQATLFARFTQKYESAAARRTALQDVERAFAAFQAERDRSRPFVLVGYGDGALFVGALFDALEDRRQLLAAYAIGLPLPREGFGDAVCQADEAGCLVAFAPVDTRFDAYAAKLAHSSLTLDARGRARSDGSPAREFLSTGRVTLICSSLLDGTREKAAAYSRGRIVFLELSTTPFCNDGLLMVPPVADRRLRAHRFFGRQWRPAPFNLFYGTLEADVAGRFQSWRALSVPMPTG